MPLHECNLQKWVELESDSRQRELRQAVHTVLLAIANSQSLSAKMLMKGGILLAIRYHGLRYTRDIDFSTDLDYSQFNEHEFLGEFRSGLIEASTQLTYDLDCRLQSHTIQPANRSDPSFPTLKLSVGYAPKYDNRRHKRLLAGQATDVIRVDYSFNETTLEIENIALTDGVSLHAYSFSDLIAEKYRAILQQEIRNRVRRQDVYDLYALFEHFPEVTETEKTKIINSLNKKAHSRGLTVDAMSLNDKSIFERSKKEYAALKSEVPDELPRFETVYEKVKDFYVSLPWKRSRS